MWSVVEVAKLHLDHTPRWPPEITPNEQVKLHHVLGHYPPQTLNDWVKKAEVDSGKRPGVSSEMAERMKALERENRELRQANEILRKASAYFAMAELDRRSK